MRLLRAAAALLCAFGLTAYGQQTTVTASSISMGGTAVTGTVTFTAVTSYGAPLSITDGGSLYVAQGFTAAVTNGAIAAGFAVPDQCLAVASTANTPVYYQAQIYNTATKTTYTLQGLTGICGATFALDHYVPTSTASVSFTALSSGATVPAKCTAPAKFYTLATAPVSYSCVGGVFVQDSGGSGVALPATTALLKGNGSGGAIVAVAGTDYDAPGAAAAAQASAANANNITSGTLNTARLATNTPGGVPTLGAEGHVSTAQLGGKNLWQYLVAGDSYPYGLGTSTLRNGYAYLVERDTPASYSRSNVAVGGVKAGSVTQQVLGNWTPDPSHIQPSLLLVQDGGNDAQADSGLGCANAASSACITNYQQSMAAIAGWAASAPQNRIMASTATATGTWATDSTIGINANAGTGTALHSSVSGATLTFTVPATNNGHIAVYQPTVNGGAGTYTISIGGVLQSYNCGASLASTTTFSSGPCAGVAIPTSPSEQRFDFYNAAWSGQQVSVVITTTNASQVAITDVEYVPQTLPSNAGAAFVVDISTQAGDSTGYYSTAVANVVSSLAAAGQQVYLVQERAALAPLAGDGTSGSTYSQHPSDAGHFAIYQAVLSAENSGGYHFSCPNCGGDLLAVNQLGIYANHTTYDLFNLPNTNQTIGVGDLLFYNQSGSQVTGRRYGYGTVADGTANTGYYSIFGSAQSIPSHFCVSLSGQFGQLQTESQYHNNLCVKFATGDLYSLGYLRGNLTATAIGSTIASAATIAPTAGMVHITGTAAVSVMTPPTGCTTSGTGCTIRLIPDGAFTTATGGGTGGFAIASTAVVGRVLQMSYDPATALWYPSY